MRKLVKVLLAATLVMSMGLTAVAAPSVAEVYSVSGATDKDGNAVALTTTVISDAVDAVSVLASAGITVVDSDIAVIVQEITAPDGFDAWPLTITLSITGVTADHPVYVLHYTDGAWEYVEATAGDGTVTFTVDSLSPIAVVIEEAPATTSPQTGDYSTAIMMLAVVALGTALVVSKRKVA